MATAKLSSGTHMWGFSVLGGIGLGIVLTTLVTAAQLSAPPHLIAITSGLLIAVRSLGGAIGLSIYSALFSSRIATALPNSIASAVVPLGFNPQYLGMLIGALNAHDDELMMKIPGITPQIIGAAVGGLKTGYLVSFRWVWGVAGILSAVAAVRKYIFILCCLFIRRRES